MSRIRDLADLRDEDQLVRIKITKKSKRQTNDKTIILNKKKPWKKRRDKIKKLVI